MFWAQNGEETLQRRAFFLAPMAMGALEQVTLGHRGTLDAMILLGAIVDDQAVERVGSARDDRTEAIEFVEQERDVDERGIVQDASADQDFFLWCHDTVAYRRSLKLPRKHLTCVPRGLRVPSDVCPS